MRSLIALSLLLALVLLAGCAGSLNEGETPTSTSSLADRHTSVSTAIETETHETETFSAFTRGRISGEFVTRQQNDVPAVRQGTPATVHLLVHNREGKSINYTVVVQIRRLDVTTSTEGTVTNVPTRRTVATQSVTVPAGEHEFVTPTIVINETGAYDLTYLLYKSDPPRNPTEETAVQAFYGPLDVVDAVPTSPSSDEGTRTE